MPQIAWAAFLPMGLAARIIIQDVAALMRGVSDHVPMATG